MADLAIRSWLCILPNTWLLGPQTTPIQGVLHRNGFAGIQLDAAAWFSEMWDTWGVVLETSQ
jgi:hypothetical protein